MLRKGAFSGYVNKRPMVAAPQTSVAANIKVLMRFEWLM